MFGIITALTGAPLIDTSDVDAVAVLKRAPRTMLWMWLNVLAFTISNQRLPSSILEDSINKPWRPLPADRITEKQARRLLLALIPIVVLLTFMSGGGPSSMAALLLAWMYNDLKGADETFIVRHILNGLGIACWSFGAATVASGPNTFSNKGYFWIALPGMITLTTIHLMDLRDQEGDRAQGRSTVPLVLGDTIARWSIVAAILSWSVICPTIWSAGLAGSVLPLALGGLISGRVLALRTPHADRFSWNLWGPWLFSIFLLPLLKDVRFLEQSSN